MKNFTKQYWKLILTIAVTLIVGYYILPVSIPLILAFFTALILNPLIRWFIAKFKINRKLAVTFVFLLFLLVISVIGTFAITKTVTQVINFAEKVPDYILQIYDQIIVWQADLDHFTSDIPEDLMKQIKDEIESTILTLSNSLKEVLKFERLAKVVSLVPELIVSLIVYLIALFLFMLELPKLKANVYKHLKEKTAEKVKFMNARLSYVILGFFKAQFLVSIIIFIISLIGLWIIAPEYALIMSLIIWLIDFVPIIGSIVILGPWALYMFIAGDPVTGVQLSVLAIILLAIRRTVEPKVMGKHIGLSPLATLIAMYIGLQILGILGFIVGPLLVIAFNSAKEAGIIKWNFKI
ncbi:sporulation integral membrane protein YtvI [Gracilibacillus ureilyticus]|uniref:Sporulation integral membrane protein YtvI n=1 Tax=Gracilibacillus ureilyticus TaxID=531814 RepID=A0A1H9TIZ8_9BACI|nr:sporulation integral membrane protein YtvI [Gracilibacillus ureilyticus]SER96997.1 sporulation integral membrane protein YtvI [Gracilibacillus ureilyticus]